MLSDLKDLFITTEDMKKMDRYSHGFKEAKDPASVG